MKFFRKEQSKRREVEAENKRYFGVIYEEGEVVFSSNKRELKRQLKELEQIIKQFIGCKKLTLDLVQPNRLLITINEKIELNQESFLSTLMMVMLYKLNRIPEEVQEIGLDYPNSWLEKMPTD
jgi:hypothetical protein